MDLGEVAIQRAETNTRLEGIEVDFQHGDVFDALRAYGAGPEEERPEVTVVDPPKWARDRSGLEVLGLPKPAMTNAWTWTYEGMLFYFDGYGRVSRMVVFSP